MKQDQIFYKPVDEYKYSVVFSKIFDTSIHEQLNFFKKTKQKRFICGGGIMGVENKTKKIKQGKRREEQSSHNI